MMLPPPEASILEQLCKEAPPSKDTLDKFVDFLVTFWSSQTRKVVPGSNTRPHCTCGGKDVHLGVLYARVQARGGYHHVTAGKLWARIRDEFAIDNKVATSASSHLRKLYEQWLLPLEDCRAAAPLPPTQPEVLTAEEASPRKLSVAALSVADRAPSRFMPSYFLACHPLQDQAAPGVVNAGGNGGCPSGSAVAKRPRVSSSSGDQPHAKRPACTVDSSTVQVPSTPLAAGLSASRVKDDESVHLNLDCAYSLPTPPRTLPDKSCTADNIHMSDERLQQLSQLLATHDPMSSLRALHTIQRALSAQGPSTPPPSPPPASAEPQLTPATQTALGVADSQTSSASAAAAAASHSKDVEQAASAVSSHGYILLDRHPFLQQGLLGVLRVYLDQCSVQGRGGVTTGVVDSHNEVRDAQGVGASQQGPARAPSPPDQAQGGSQQQPAPAGSASLPSEQTQAGQKGSEQRIQGESTLPAAHSDGAVVSETAVERSGQQHTAAWTQLGGEELLHEAAMATAHILCGLAQVPENVSHMAQSEAALEVLSGCVERLRSGPQADEVLDLLLRLLSALLSDPLNPGKVCTVADTLPECMLDSDRSTEVRSRAAVALARGLRNPQASPSLLSRVRVCSGALSGAFAILSSAMLTARAESEGNHPGTMGSQSAPHSEAKQPAQATAQDQSDANCGATAAMADSARVPANAAHALHAATQLAAAVFEAAAFTRTPVTVADSSEAVAQTSPATCCGLGYGTTSSGVAATAGDTHTALPVFGSGAGQAVPPSSAAVRVSEPFLGTGGPSQRRGEVGHVGDRGSVCEFPTLAGASSAAGMGGEATGASASVDGPAHETFRRWMTDEARLAASGSGIPADSIEQCHSLPSLAHWVPSLSLSLSVSLGGAALSMATSQHLPASDAGGGHSASESGGGGGTPVHPPSAPTAPGVAGSAPVQQATPRRMLNASPLHGDHAQDGPLVPGTLPDRQSGQIPGEEGRRRPASPGAPLLVPPLLIDLLCHLAAGKWVEPGAGDETETPVQQCSRVRMVTAAACNALQAALMLPSLVPWVAFWKDGLIKSALSDAAHGPFVLDVVRKLP